MSDVVDSKRKVWTSDTWKNIIIVGLIIALIILLWTNTLDETSRERFYWFAFGLCCIVAVVYLLLRRKKLDIYAMAKQIADNEAKATNLNLDITSFTSDILDTETQGFGWETGGKAIAYKFNIIDNVVCGRLIKTLDEVKKEINDREISRTIALDKLERGSDYRVSSVDGYGVDDPDPAGRE